MLDALRSYLSLANGLTEVTRERAKAAARALVAQGEATAEQVGSLTDDLLTTSRTNSEAILNLVRTEVDRTLSRLGLVTADELQALQARVRELERELAASGRNRAAQPTAPTGGVNAADPFEGRTQEAPAKKAAAKKTAVKEAAARSGDTAASGTSARKATPAKKGTKKAGTTASTRTAAAQNRRPAARTAKRTTGGGGGQ